MSHVADVFGLGLIRGYLDFPATATAIMPYVE